MLSLGEIRQRAGKRVIAFAIEGDFDPDAHRAGHVRAGVAAALGRTRSFPEIDRVAWFDLETAKAKLVKGQIPLLERLPDARKHRGQQP